jgi:hypothetical protein
MLFASRFARVVRCGSALLAAVSLVCPTLQAQAPPASLQITILDGDEAMNNIRQRTAREPIVQVEDENHKPVAGAAVTFLLPNDGPGGTFAGGARTMTVTTDSKGQAVGRGLHPNHAAGRYQIRVSASFQGLTAQAIINQTNQAGGANAASSHTTAKWISVLVAGAVTATAVAVGTHSGSTATSNVPVAVIPVTGSVGPPR